MVIEHDRNMYKTPQGPNLKERHRNIPITTPIVSALKNYYMYGGAALKRATWSCLRKNLKAHVGARDPQLRLR
jgi:hypothetical protein